MLISIVRVLPKGTLCSYAFSQIVRSLADFVGNPTESSDISLYPNPNYTTFSSESNKIFFGTCSYIIINIRIRKKMISFQCNNNLIKINQK